MRGYRRKGETKLEPAAGPLIKDTNPKAKKNMGLEGIGRKS